MLSTANGTVAPVSELGGWATTYNGTSSSTTIAGTSRTKLLTKFTYELWVRATTNAQTDRYWLNRSNAPAILYEFVNNNVEFFVTGYTGTNPRTGSGIVVDDTNWHHIVYSYDGVTWAGYKDGVAIFSSAVTFAINDFTETADWYLGSAAGANFGSCEIAEVRIYDRGRSAANVRAAYAPETRWALYRPIANKVYFDLSGGGGGSTRRISAGIVG